MSATMSKTNPREQLAVRRIEHEVVVFRCRHCNRRIIEQSPDYVAAADFDGVPCRHVCRCGTTSYLTVGRSQR